MSAQKNNDKVIIAIGVAILMLIGIVSKAVSGDTGNDSPTPVSRTWHCPEGTQHYEDMDPMSGDAAAMRDQGILVGTDGVGGSCVG